LSDSGGNSDDGQASTNVVDDDGDGGGDDNDEDDDKNDDWDSVTKMTMFSVRFHFLPHLVINHLETDKCLFLHANFFGYFLVQLCSMK
jgi:hypothetical protein